MNHAAYGRNDSSEPPQDEATMNTSTHDLAGGPLTQEISDTLVGDYSDLIKQGLTPVQACTWLLMDEGEEDWAWWLPPIVEAVTGCDGRTARRTAQTAVRLWLPLLTDYVEQLGCVDLVNVDDMARLGEDGAAEVVARVKDRIDGHTRGLYRWPFIVRETINEVAAEQQQLDDASMRLVGAPRTDVLADLDGMPDPHAWIPGREGA